MTVQYCSTRVHHSSLKQRNAVNSIHRDGNPQILFSSSWSTCLVFAVAETMQTDPKSARLTHGASLVE
jgi:hypothetical protein